MTKPIDGICPECEYIVDDSTGLNKARGLRPEPGDLALCINCSGMSFYVDNGETLGLRAPTEEEFRVLSNNRSVQDARAAMRAAFGSLAK